VLSLRKDGVIPKIVLEFLEAVADTLVVAPIAIPTEGDTTTMIQTCHMCECPLPSLIPSIKAKASIADGVAQLVPSQDGTYHICLGCAPKMVSIFDVTCDDPLSAQLWVSAINDAWAEIEPGVEFYLSDYRQDTV